MSNQPEQQRLRAAYDKQEPWLFWGPYLSERQWGTVREDYSEDGEAWRYFTYEQSLSRAYRWGEDGLGGISDQKQRLCLALALWNGADSHLKERLFGLTNDEGNHGEDVKEVYFYQDNTPAHSFMKYLYKYPQRAFPYEKLRQVNEEQGFTEGEYELLDTGIFDEDRYFDVEIRYAKSLPHDILMEIRVTNRGPEAAPLYLLPTLWFRNTWSWEKGAEKPKLRKLKSRGCPPVIRAYRRDIGTFYLYAEDPKQSFFTDNETHKELLFGENSNHKFVKDGFHRYLINAEKEAVNPKKTGTKGAFLYQLQLHPGETRSVRLRMTNTRPEDLGHTYGWWNGELFGEHFTAVMQQREEEAHSFYASIYPKGTDPENQHIFKQALSGMLWNKQYYYYDLYEWLNEHHANPVRTSKLPPKVRNKDWFHMINDDIISMPDKWEYPWYAAWDLAFQAIALALVDVDFAKQQLDLMLRERYLHPSGQLPAYEWEFSDVNPPVHAWATLYVYHVDRQKNGNRADIPWLKHAFQKLQLNFTWWVNRKDPFGRNVFEGGFLGLDNIGVFDRSRELPTGGRLEQADGTAWMALYCQNMFEMALELADHDPVYEEMALKFFEHFLYIAAAMDRKGDSGDLWDEADGFFYDVLSLPDGTSIPLRVRSMVGLLSLCATTVVPGDLVERFPRLAQRALFRFKRHPELLHNIHDPRETGYKGRRMFAVLDRDKLQRILYRLLDENEFLSPYGIRALSRYHADHPYSFQFGEEEYKVAYLPAESDSPMFGGNSNWRGPVWFPVNTLVIRALMQFYTYYGEDFKVECPTGSGNWMNLFEVSREIAWRLICIFRPDASDKRPVYGDWPKMQEDPHWRDHLLFFEYFNGDNGRGLGAGHQTGWTGLVAMLIQMFGSGSAERILAEGFRPSAFFEAMDPTNANR